MVKKIVDPNQSPEPPKGLLITGGLYDRLQFLVRVVLPALSALYFGLGNIWDFPEIEKVVGTLAVLVTVLGSMLQVSASNYKKSDGDVDAYIPPGSPLLDDFAGKDKVTFKVNPDLAK